MNVTPSTISASKKRLVFRLLLIASLVVVLTFTFSFSLYSSSFYDDLFMFTNSNPKDASSSDPLVLKHTHYPRSKYVIQTIAAISSQPFRRSLEEVGLVESLSVANAARP